MLKANSKKARQNLIDYIGKYATEAIESEYENGAKMIEENGLYTTIYEKFRKEKSYYFEQYSRTPESKIFEDWAQGLPLNDLFCYYCNRSAVDDLGAILEETDGEKARYTESQAEEMLTQLIYIRVKSEAGKEEIERR